jgi:hypothetical protein
MCCFNCSGVSVDLADATAMTFMVISLALGWDVYEGKISSRVQALGSITNDIFSIICAILDFVFVLQEDRLYQ